MKVEGGEREAEGRRQRKEGEKEGTGTHRVGRGGGGGGVRHVWRVCDMPRWCCVGGECAAVCVCVFRKTDNQLENKQIKKAILNREAW